MTLKLDISGINDLFDLAEALRDAGEKKLSAKLDRSVRKAAGVIEDEVRAHTDDYMPKGYERTFAQALEVKIESRLVTGRRITIVFSAKGKRKQRDIGDMEMGQLKHPVFGRTRRLKNGGVMRNPWVAQRIRPGWASEPAERAAPKAVAVIDKSVGEVVDAINKAV